MPYHYLPTGGFRGAPSGQGVYLEDHVDFSDSEYIGREAEYERYQQGFRPFGRGGGGGVYPEGWSRGKSEFIDCMHYDAKQGTFVFSRIEKNWISKCRQFGP